MQIFLVLVVTFTIFLFVMKLGGRYAGRVTGGMMTDHFKAAEALLEHERLPEHWIERLLRMERRDRLIQLLPGGRGWQERGEVYLLKQIHQLRAYFSKSPFFDSDETRSMLLAKLDDLIASWESLGLEGITKLYDVRIENS